MGFILYAKIRLWQIKEAKLWRNKLANFSARQYNTGYNYRVSTDSVSHGYRKTIVEEDDKLISYMRGYIDVIADNKAHATIVNQGVLLATIRFFIEECIRYFITKDGKKSEKVEMIEKRMMSESIMNAAFNVNRGNLSESEKTIVSYIKQHKPEKIYDILRWL